MRLAFKDHLFDAIAVPLQRFHGASVEWCAVRQAANGVEDALAHIGAAACQGLGRRDGEGALAGFNQRLRFVLHVVGKHTPDLLILAQAMQEIESVGVRVLCKSSGEATARQDEYRSRKAQLQIQHADRISYDRLAYGQSTLVSHCFLCRFRLTERN